MPGGRGGAPEEATGRVTCLQRGVGGAGVQSPCGESQVGAEWGGARPGCSQPWRRGGQVPGGLASREARGGAGGGRGGRSRPGHWRWPRGPSWAGRRAAPETLPGGGSPGCGTAGTLSPRKRRRPRRLRAQGERGPKAQPVAPEGARPKAAASSRSGACVRAGPGDRARLRTLRENGGWGVVLPRAAAQAAGLRPPQQVSKTLPVTSCAGALGRWAAHWRPVRAQDTPPGARPLLLRSHTRFWGACLALHPFAKGLQWSWVQGGLRPRAGPPSTPMPWEHGPQRGAAGEGSVLPQCAGRVPPVA